MGKAYGKQLYNLSNGLVPPRHAIDNKPLLTSTSLNITPLHRQCSIIVYQSYIIYFAKAIRFVA